MSDFDEFIKEIKAGSKELAKEIFDGFEKEAAKDARTFLDKFKADLQRWTQLLATSELNEQDFSDLVQAKKALAEIHALRQAGVALTKLERFRSGLINLVIESAYKAFL